MYTTRVDRKENELVLTVTPEMQEHLHLKPGERIEIEVTRGKRRSRFAPGQLLREHAGVMNQLEDSREWIDSRPVGREVL